ncbi:MAG: hypothetical protein HY917_05155, partial [Candidatus Diapherotrites archaeon]|nr:hypothetical protein [Candidatus Diapherotrites archaeon]
MWIEIILGIVGLYLLIRGSDWVTDAAIPLAKSLNTTRVAVGLVLVSFLLSLPELFVAISSVIKGHPQLGVGVSIGSIIVNLGLIIGFSAIIRPIHIPRHVITRDLVFMSVITIVVFLLALQNLELTRNDGFVLLLLFVPYLINVYEQERSLAGREREKEAESLATTLYRVGKVDNPPFFWNEKIMFLIGALLLLVGSELFTNSLISLAQI